MTASTLEESTPEDPGAGAPPGLKEARTPPPLSDSHSLPLRTYTWTSLHIRTHRSPSTGNRAALQTS